MNLVSFATQYLTLHILLALAFGFAALIFTLNQRFIIIKPPAKIWSATASASFDREFKMSGDEGYLSIDILRVKPLAKTNTLAFSFWFGMMAVFLFGLIKFLKGAGALVRLY